MLVMYRQFTVEVVFERPPKLEWKGLIDVFMSSWVALMTMMCSKAYSSIFRRLQDSLPRVCFWCRHCAWAQKRTVKAMRDYVTCGTHPKKQSIIIETVYVYYYYYYYYYLIIIFYLTFLTFSCCILTCKSFGFVIGRGIHGAGRPSHRRENTRDCIAAATISRGARSLGEQCWRPTQVWKTTLNIN